VIAAEEGVVVNWYGVYETKIKTKEEVVVARVLTEEEEKLLKEAVEVNLMA